MRSKMLWALVLTIPASSPAGAVELLTNGGFESGPPYAPWVITGLDGTGLGETPHSGTKSWHGAWNFDGSAQTTNVRQDVPVLAGESYTASMWFKGEAFGGVYGPETMSFALRLQFRDAGNNVIETHDAASGDPTGAYQQLLIEGKIAPPGAVTARVRFQYITTQPAHAWKVWNVDDVSLEGVSPCGSQHELISINPTSSPNDANVDDAVVTGTNMSGVTEVRLVQGATVIPGTGLVTTGTTATADFATAGQPLGFYNVVVEQDGCSNRTLTNAFEITCAGGAGPTFFATLDGWGGPSGNPSYSFDLTGSGLDHLTQVRLVKKNENNGTLPGSASNPIVSSGLVPSEGGNRLTVTVDTTGAEGGRYLIEGTHPCGLVTYAPGFADGPFLMWMPLNTAPGPNGEPLIVHNASFEEGYRDLAQPGFCEVGFSGDANDKAKHWEQVPAQSVTSGGTVGSWSRDKALGMGTPTPPDCPAVAKLDGAHYEDQTVSQIATAKHVAFFQTVDVSPLLTGNMLTNPLTIRASFLLHCGGEPAALNAYIELRDGPEETAVLGTSAAIPTLGLEFDADPAWQVTLPAGTVISNASKIMTILFRGEKQATGAAQFLIMRVDNVYSGPFVAPGCHVPFADADGDGDVDQDDFAVFQLCFTGPGGPVPSSPDYCQCFDTNADSAITSADLTNFESCATGPEVPWTPSVNCP